MRLAQLLGCTFSVGPSHLRYKMAQQPEVQLMSLLLIAIKLSQGFDDLERHPRASGEPAALRVDWNAWRGASRDSQLVDQRAGLLETGRAADVTDDQALRMSSKQLDQYMDWYEKTWVDSIDPKRKAHYLLFEGCLLNNDDSPRTASQLLPNRKIN